MIIRLLCVEGVILLVVTVISLVRLRPVSTTPDQAGPALRLSPFWRFLASVVLLVVIAALVVLCASSEPWFYGFALIVHNRWGLILAGLLIGIVPLALTVAPRLLR